MPTPKSKPTKGKPTKGKTSVTTTGFASASSRIRAANCVLECQRFAICLGEGLLDWMAQCELDVVMLQEVKAKTRSPPGGRRILYRAWLSKGRLGGCRKKWLQWSFDVGEVEGRFVSSGPWERRV
jgi:hypothetical protein